MNNEQHDEYGRETHVYGRETHEYGRETHNNRSMIDLFTRLVDQMSLLFRKEVELAKAEASQKASQVGSGVVKMAIGGVLMIPALVILLQSAVAWLAVVDVDPRWGALIVGAVVAVIGIALMMSGRSATKSTNLAPRRTTHQLQRDAAVMKEQVR